MSFPGQTGGNAARSRVTTAREGTARPGPGDAVGRASSTSLHVPLPPRPSPPPSARRHAPLTHPSQRTDHTHPSEILTSTVT